MQNWISSDLKGPGMCIKTEVLWASKQFQRVLVVGFAVWIQQADISCQNGQAAKQSRECGVELLEIWCLLCCLWLCLVLQLVFANSIAPKLGWLLMSLRRQATAVATAWRQCKVREGTAEQWKHYIDLCGWHGWNVQVHGARPTHGLHLVLTLWNLRIHPWKRKIIYSKPSFSGSMLIFRGVSDISIIYHLLFLSILYRIDTAKKPKGNPTEVKHPSEIRSAYQGLGMAPGGAFLATRKSWFRRSNFKLFAHPVWLQTENLSISLGCLLGWFWGWCSISFGRSV